MLRKHSTGQRMRRRRPLATATMAITIVMAIAGGCVSATPSPTPSAVQVARDLAADYISRGQYTAAEAIYLDALAVGEDSDLATALADLYTTWGLPGLGLQALDRARAAGAPESALTGRRLTLATMSGDWDLVATTAEAILAAAPDNPEALAALLRADLEQGLCDRAGDAAQRLVATGSASDRVSQTRWLLAQDYAALKAEAPLLMVGLEACNDTCDLQMGLRLVRMERWGEAACLLRRAMDDAEQATNPPDWWGEATAWLGEAESRTNRHLDAERHLRAAVELAPASPLAWLLLGKQRLARGDLETARIALLNAQRLDPGNPAPCLAIAELKAQSGAYVEVSRWIDAALERAPQDVDVWKAAARFYLTRDLASQGDPAGISAQAVILAPNDAEVHLLQGWSSLVDGNPETALEALDLALTLDPNLAEAHYRRGLALEAAGRPADARAAYTRAADLGWQAGPGGHTLQP